MAWCVARFRDSSRWLPVIGVVLASLVLRPFPAAVHDVQAALRWLFDEAAALGVVRERIAIGGDSAGGNLAAAMTLALRGSDCRLERQLLVYPCCDFDTTRPSYLENPDGRLVEGMFGRATIELNALTLTTLSRHERHQVLDSPSISETAQVLARTDTFRWLERTAHHIWRICHYLAQGRNGVEVKPDAEEPPRPPGVA